MFRDGICGNIPSIQASSKPATSPLCSPYYKYSSEPSSSFCILSFLVRATSIDQTFYPAMHYLAAVWLDSRHGSNRNDMHWVLLKKWLLMINSADDSQAAQSFCRKNTKIRRYCFKTSLAFLIWSFILRWNAVDNRVWIFNRVQSSFQKWLINWVLRFKMIELDNLWCFYTER